MKTSIKVPTIECKCTLGTLMDKNHYLQCSVCNISIFKDKQNLPILCCGNYTKHLSNNQRKCEYCNKRYKDNYANHS